MTDLFSRLAHTASLACGRGSTFAVMFFLILLWLTLGPVFAWSDSWQLVANTSTSLVTFLVVFLIQNSQNRDTLAIHLKLDELVRAVEGARNEVAASEKLSEDDMADLVRRT
jgi:low affinity Fe/Cu permease